MCDLCTYYGLTLLWQAWEPHLVELLDEMYVCKLLHVCLYHTLRSKLLAALICIFLRHALIQKWFNKPVQLKTWTMNGWCALTYLFHIHTTHTHAYTHTHTHNKLPVMMSWVLYVFLFGRGNAGVTSSTYTIVPDTLKSRFQTGTDMTLHS